MARITDTHIASTKTRHHAEVVDDGWRVSWLPGRKLSRSQAITAMTIAEFVESGVLTSAHPKWLHVDQWADELDLSGPRAVGLVTGTDPATMRPFEED